MAERIESYVFSDVTNVRKYDWSNWLNGEIWEIEEGVDYTVKRVNFIRQVRDMAKHLGGCVRVSMRVENAVVLQFYREEGGE